LALWPIFDIEPKAGAVVPAFFCCFARGQKISDQSSDQPQENKKPAEAGFL
jgi:hypothetical protein